MKTSTSITSSPAPKQTLKILAVGGENNERKKYLSDVEMIDPFIEDANCVDPPDYPLEAQSMIGELISTIPIIPMVCGGWNSSDFNNCFQLYENKWLETTSLLHPRSNAASITIKDGVWISGGVRDSSTLTTSEI